jgi:Uma2 family endonuclease
MANAPKYDEMIWLPRAVRFPVELQPPPGFDPERPETWPQIAGRLEHWEGKLLYMPPCGDVQQDTMADVVITLGSWVRAHREFVLATNEAGMRLAGATRAADVAIWRRSDLGHRTGGLRRQPPVLAIEVSGEDENESSLVDKAHWYLSVGTTVVWLVLPEERAVMVITASGAKRYTAGMALDEHPLLPGLRPNVGEFFTQLDSP